MLARTCWEATYRRSTYAWPYTVTPLPSVLLLVVLICWSKYQRLYLLLFACKRGGGRTLVVVGQ